MGCYLPGAASLSFAMLFFIPWILTISLALVRTPLLYTPNLLPDNFIVNTTYTLLDAHSDFGAWRYWERGDVLKVEFYEDRTRNFTFGYNHQQAFSGVTCTYHVHTNVTGYASDGTPQGDVYPELDAPGCHMAVAFRGLLISAFMLTPLLSCCFLLPTEPTVEAMKAHTEYLKLHVAIGDDNLRGEGQPAGPHDSPSSSQRSPPPPAQPYPPTYSAPPTYNQPGYTIDIPYVPASPAPVMVGGVAFHAETADDAESDLPPPPSYPPSPRPPRRLRSPRPPRGPRRYLPADNADNAKMYLRKEERKLHEALCKGACALPATLLALTLPLAALGCMFGYVNDSGFGEQRELLWPVWLMVSTTSCYVAAVLMDSLIVYLPLGVAAHTYLQEDAASWRALLRGPQ